MIQHVTELDFAINDRLQGTAVMAVTPELLADQAERYRSLMDLLMRKRLVSATLVWGISDAHSWLNGWLKPRVEAPLMFDRQLAPAGLSRPDGRGAQSTPPDPTLRPSQAAGPSDVDDRRSAARQADERMALVRMLCREPALSRAPIWPCAWG